VRHDGAAQTVKARDAIGMRIRQHDKSHGLIGEPGDLGAPGDGIGGPRGAIYADCAGRGDDTAHCHAMISVLDIDLRSDLFHTDHTD